jgi:RimJ/RimL family protein N-acetyltransferase
MNLRLQPFKPRFAHTIATWVQDERDLFWLAPRTSFPLTPEKILQWSTSHNELLVLSSPDDDLMGYAEINTMSRNPRNLWLGHIIIPPHHRTRRLGRRFVRLLLEKSFQSHDALRVSLVVFPENHAAVHCYYRAGFTQHADEFHQFHPTGRKVRMLRMDVEREAWLTSRWPVRSDAPSATSTHSDLGEDIARKASSIEFATEFTTQSDRPSADR